MCSQNQRVRPGKFMRMPDFFIICRQRVRPDCRRRNCCGVVGVQKELETHDAKEKGEWSWWSHGAQQHDEKQCEKSAYGSRAGVQGAVATFTAAPGSGPGLCEVSGCWNCPAKM